jgi:hypothetical protein
MTGEGNRVLRIFSLYINSKTPSEAYSNRVLLVIRWGALADNFRIISTSYLLATLGIGVADNIKVIKSLGRNIIHITRGSKDVIAC